MHSELHELHMVLCCFKLTLKQILTCLVRMTNFSYGGGRYSHLGCFSCSRGPGYTDQAMVIPCVGESSPHSFSVLAAPGVRVKLCPHLPYFLI